MEPGAIIGKLLPLLFNMMGPIGLMPVFAAMTAQMDAPTRNRVALRSASFAAIGVLVAVLIGDTILRGWGVSNASLVVAAGVILTLSAIRGTLPPSAAPAPPVIGGDPAAIAVRPLAFPTIVSPQGIGVVIIFVAFLQSGPAKLTVVAVAAFILLLDYGAMRIAHWFMAKIGMVPLMVLGAVFGVLQVALGIEMLLSGFKLAGHP
ncbi:MAG: MarC family protein [Candidatus Kaistia colombiensis]|nr:MAG: MarC family protein [Kaistia sp.]